VTTFIWTLVRFGWMWSVGRGDNKVEKIYAIHYIIKSSNKTLALLTRGQSKDQEQGKDEDKDKGKDMYVCVLQFFEGGRRRVRGPSCLKILKTSFQEDSCNSITPCFPNGVRRILRLRPCRRPPLGYWVVRSGRWLAGKIASSCDQ